jgi:hypothetical protein
MFSESASEKILVKCAKDIGGKLTSRSLVNVVFIGGAQEYAAAPQFVWQDRGVAV